MAHHKIFVANWKMNKSFAESISFGTTYRNALNDMAKQQNATLILCPSFLALHSLAKIFEGTAIAIGAQDCATYQSGAYTGEVDALSLVQAGATYCIIGHSERRTLFGETNAMITQKLAQLIKNNISPVICIGESRQAYEQKQTTFVLEQQLEALYETIKIAPAGYQLYIAYEPIWSIGTGIVADNSYINEIGDWIAKTASRQFPNLKISILYGGSVTDHISKELLTLTTIQGFLIGNASLDFQKLQNIVSFTK